MVIRILRYKIPLLLLAALLVALTLSCGSRKMSNSLDTGVLSGDGFSLTLLDKAGEPLPDTGMAELKVVRDGGGITVTAKLTKDGLPLGADFYAELAYPQDVHPTAFTPGAAFGKPDSYISVAVMDRNPLPVGISLAAKHRAGIVRAGELFTVHFAPGSAAWRTASGAPVGSFNVLHAEDINLVVNGQYVTFQWKEKNRGDYDRDGRVTIADITPIAMYFGITPTDNADIADLVDASGNGVVDIEDITPIAMNYQNAIVGYRIWRSNLTEGDYLPNVDNPSEPSVSASRPSLTGAPPGRLNYTYQDYAPDLSVYYVFYPYGDDVAGVASDEIHPFSADHTAPAWDSNIGIISAMVETGPNIRFTFGRAQDASPPVRYRLYWQEGPGPINFATANIKTYGVIDGEPIPYERLLLASDGVVDGQLYALCVRAFDLYNNETANVNYVLAGGSTTDVTPPAWTSDAGITGAIAGDGQVTVSWGEATDAESPPVTYLLYYALAADGIDWGMPQSTFPSTTRTTLVSSLTNGEQYVFGVRAQDASANQNTTSNTNTLTATPQAVGPSPFPFSMPPEGQQELTLFPVTDSALTTDTDNCPAIVAVDKAGVGINFFYYDEGAAQWQMVNIDSPNRYYHPAIALAGSSIYVVAYDGTADELVQFTGTTDAQTWVRSVIDDAYANCYELSLAYDAGTNALAVAAALEPALGNEEVVYYSMVIGLSLWNKELVDDSQPNVSSLSVAVDPFTGEHCVAYANGIITEGAEPSLNVQLKFARRTGVNAFDIETVYNGTNTVNAEMLELAFDPVTGLPYIAMAYSHTVFFETMEVPITDATVCGYDGTEWDFSTIETREPELNGLDFYFYFAGADPQISFANGLSFGAFTYAYVEAIYYDGGATLGVQSSIKESYFSGTWSFPLEQTDPFEGASADSLGFPDGSAQISYAAIGVLDYGPTRNNYPEGNLNYFREP